MRADRDVDRAVGQPGQDLLALGPPVTRLVSSSTRSGRSPNRLPGSGTFRSPSSARTPVAVLLGEHLGRRHQRALVPALHRVRAASITATTVLPEPTSPCSSRCIGWGPARSAVDLGDHASLGAGERVRQRVVEAAHELAVDDVRQSSRRPLELALAHDQHELHAQQLVERQPPASGVLVAHRLGRVDRRAAPPRGRRARAAGGPPRARGRRCHDRGNVASASSTQPASSHVLSCAFSLCG